MSQRKIVNTKAAPAAIGPYSQAVIHGDLVFLSGAIPLDPVTGTVIEGGIHEQTVRVMENLKAVLEAAGSRMSQVLRTGVFLADINDFNAMNEVYAGYFTSSPPARSTVEVARLPRNVRIEIDCIAAIEKK